MPEPHPDLRFDQERAAVVVQRARELLQLLEQQATLRRQNADRLRPSWRGAYARRFFGDELPRAQRQTAELLQELRTLIHRVESAAETADEWARQNARYRERP